VNSANPTLNWGRLKVTKSFEINKKRVGGDFQFAWLAINEFRQLNDRLNSFPLGEHK